MNNDRLPNIHPGEILRLEFLEPLDITPYQLSKDIGVATEMLVVGFILQPTTNIVLPVLGRKSKREMRIKLWQTTSKS